MKINLAQSAGFCFGVKRAIDIALGSAKAGGNIYMLGDIVHNEDVVRQLGQAGIKKITRLGPGKNKTLLVRAHGAGLKTFKTAARLGYKIIDATCPMVKEIHKIARDMENKGYRIIVIGDKRHDEVQGIVGQLKSRAVIIEDAAALPPAGIEKAAVVVQSTQNTQQVLEIVKKLRRKIPQLKFFNTICRPTRMRQEETKQLPLVNDVMIIIGSRSSANTKRLYQISRALNRRTYWVSSKENLKKAWFRHARRVGVTSGASTPDVTTQEIISRIRLLSLQS